MADLRLSRGVGWWQALPKLACMLAYAMFFFALAWLLPVAGMAFIGDYSGTWQFFTPDRELVITRHTEEYSDDNGNRLPLGALFLTLQRGGTVSLAFSTQVRPGQREAHVSWQAGKEKPNSETWRVVDRDAAGWRDLLPPSPAIILSSLIHADWLKLSMVDEAGRTIVHNVNLKGMATAMATALAQASCVEKSLERGKLKGIYNGIDLPEFTPFLNLAEEGAEPDMRTPAMICGEDEAERFFGKSTGVPVEVDYEIRQLWFLDSANPLDGRCVRHAVCVGGRVLGREGVGTPANASGKSGNQSGARQSARSSRPYERPARNPGRTADTPPARKPDTHSERPAGLPDAPRWNAPAKNYAFPPGHPAREAARPR